MGAFVFLIALFGSVLFGLICSGDLGAWFSFAFWGWKLVERLMPLQASILVDICFGLVFFGTLTATYIATVNPEQAPADFKQTHGSISPFQQAAHFLQVESGPGIPQRCFRQGPVGVDTWADP